MVLAVVAMMFSLLQLLWGGHWRPWLLSAAAFLYLGYTMYLFSHS
jgi:cation:H+ antiporter